MKYWQRKKIVQNTIGIILSISLLLQSSPLMALSYEVMAQVSASYTLDSLWASLSESFRDTWADYNVGQPTLNESAPPALADAAPPTLAEVTTMASIANNIANKPFSALLAKPRQQPPPLLSAIPLLPDWNLISIPTSQPDTDPTAVLADIAGEYNAAFAYDGCVTDPWQIYDPSAPPVTNDLTAIDPTIGFWIQATGSTSLPISGSVPPSTTIQLCTGWNLIGMPTEQVRPVRNALFSIDGKYSRVFGYDPADSQDPWEVYDVTAPDWANDLQMMQPGRGYWILATADVTLTIANEGQPPIARLISPDELETEDISSITFITDVVGTAFSDFLDSWTLSYRLKGEGQWTPFATGTTPVLSDTLGLFDPTLLLNGIYEFELAATDYSGLTALAYADVLIEGEAKIGHFTLPLLDLEVPLLGLPIQVVRTYDSRDKEVGDFGVGWRLSLNDIRLVESVPPGDAWQSILDVPGGPLPFWYYDVETRTPHIVTVIFPDGEIFKFKPTITPSRALFVFPEVVDMSYEPMPGTNATLEPLDASTHQLTVVGSFPPPPEPGGGGFNISEESLIPRAIQLWNLDALAVHDPSLYKMTMPDGREFVIHQEHGLQSITDLNGNVLTVSENGISHSSGVGLVFDRDEQGRIFQITDPLLHTLTYQYDENGDLTFVTDQENQTTEYRYIDNHYLDTIIDPNGVEVAAMMYDGDGRLVQLCNAENNCLQTIHDIGSNQEIIVDETDRTRIVTYDSQGNVIASEDALGNTSTFEYDDQGNLLQETNPNGLAIRYTYDERNNLTATTAPFSPLASTNIYTTTYTYDERDQLLSITQPTGAQTLFSYDDRGNLLDARDGQGNLILNYTYDAAGNVTSEGDPFGTNFYDDFDALGNPRLITDEFGSVTTAAYDAMGQLTSMVENGVTDVFDYDAQGRPLSDTFGSGVTINYEYGPYDGPNDWIVSEANTMGRTERLVSPSGRFEGWVLPDGREVSYVYDAAGRPLQETDPLGNVTQYSYDLVGRIDSVESPLLGGRITYAYDAGSRIISQTTGLGTQFFTYNPDGQVKTVTDPLGRTISYSYTLTSTTIIDPLDRTTTIILSPEENPIKQINPDGSTVEIEYLVSHSGLEPEEYPAHITDEGGNVRTFAYDSLGRLTAATDLAGVTYTLQYNGDSLAGFTNPLSETIGFTTDNNGNITAVTYPDNGIRQIDYSFSRDPITITQPSGTVITFAYDEFGQQIDRADSDGDAYSLTWIGSSGILSKTTDSTGTTQYLYDHLGRLAGIDYPDQASIRYGYDAFGRMVTVTMQVSDTAPIYSTYYGYDAVGNLITITDPLNGLTTRQYDMAGRLVTQTLPNGVTSIYAYNDRDQVTSLIHRDSSQNVISSFIYERDGIGEPTRITQEDGSYVLLGYDDALRLVSEGYYDLNDTLLETITYTYDLAGNRIAHSNGSGNHMYGYDPGYQLTSIAGPSGIETYDYDADGRTMQIVRDGATHTFDYNSRDLLTAVNDISSGTIVSYTYDALGRRVQARTITGTRQFLVAPMVGIDLESPHAVYDESGQLISGYVYAGEIPLMRFGPEGPIYYLPDARGSIVALADNTGNGVANFDYDSFGNVRAASGDGKALPANIGGDFRFHGAWLEATTGLYHFRAREYDTQTGRFLSRDAADPNFRQPETAHAYAFALANPHIYRDPTGLFTIVELNTTQGVQNHLQKISAQVFRQALRQAKEEIGEFVADILLDFLTGWLPIDGAIQSVVGNKGNAFEDAASNIICDLLLGTGNVANFFRIFYFEVKVLPSTGEPVSDGITCGERGTKNPRLGLQVPRPDFLISQHAPTTLSPNGPYSFLIGDFKLRASTAVQKWGKGGGTNSQWQALVKHAKRFSYADFILLIVWRGARAKKSLKRLYDLAAQEQVILYVLTMD